MTKPSYTNPTHTPSYREYQATKQSSRIPTGAPPTHYPSHDNLPAATAPEVSVARARSVRSSRSPLTGSATPKERFRVPRSTPSPPETQPPHAPSYFDRLEQVGGALGKAGYYAVTKPLTAVAEAAWDSTKSVVTTGALYKLYQHSDAIDGLLRSIPIIGNSLPRTQEMQRRLIIRGYNSQSQSTFTVA